MEIEPGDLVLVKKENISFKGVLIKRPEFLDENFILLKLQNGYNIGIRFDEKTTIELVEKRKEKEKRELFEGKGEILIYAVGGTIMSKIDYRTGGVHALFHPTELIELIPKIEEIASISVKKRSPLKMSEDLTPKDWVEISNEIYREIDRYKGIIILHGTDTMHYTSAALSFFFRNLNKPIIITGSQRSSDRGSSDAYSNILASIIAAKNWDGAEVCICMHANLNDEYNYLIRGTRVRKMHTERRDAFRPINEKPLARIYYNGKIEIINNNYRKRHDGDVVLDNKINEKVFYTKFYPGYPPELISWARERFDGIVIEGTGFGHVNSLEEYGLIEEIKQTVEEGKPVVITSQTIYGRTNPYVYTNLRKLSIYCGAIYVEDMLPEVAYVKLMWVLGKTKDLEEVRKLMLTNFAGEISERSDIEGFLV